MRVQWVNLPTPLPRKIGNYLYSSRKKGGTVILYEVLAWATGLGVEGPKGEPLRLRPGAHESSYGLGGTYGVMLLGLSFHVWAWTINRTYMGPFGEKLDFSLIT